LATTEPGSGSDSASIITRADAVDGGYVLNGQKAWISNAGLADYYVVFAKTDPSQRSRGVSAFLLPRGTEGMEFGAPMKKMGQRVPGELLLRGIRARTEPPRGGGAGLLRAHAHLRHLPCRARRGSTGHRPGGLRVRPRLCAGAHPVRQDDHRPPGGGLPSGRY